MKNTRNTRKQNTGIITALLAAALLSASLTGCGETGQPVAASDSSRNSNIISEFDRDLYPDLYPPYPSVNVNSMGTGTPETEKPVTGTRQPATETEKPVTGTKQPATEAEKPVTGTKQPATETEKPENIAETEPERDMASLEAIKEISTLVGTWSPEYLKYRKYQIEIDGNENPYGLSWQYKPAERNRDYSRLNRLYDEYVDACDWSLVFDVEFYKAAFPMLALQYNNNYELLTEHFQTVGVREGRQGCESFNLAVYMENCDGKIRTAFGDDYECYYFYYMLNQDTEKSVDTANTGKTYPVWLTIELSQYQEEELKAVNKFREEVGAAPLTADPELMAFASWRAWYDVINEMYAHDWMNEETDTLDGYLDEMGLGYYGENTVKSYDAVHTQYLSIGQTANKYRNSEPHYEAMVRGNNLYFGCSDIYYSGEHTMAAQFDLFAREASTSPYLADK